MNNESNSPKPQGIKRTREKVSKPTTLAFVMQGSDGTVVYPVTIVQWSDTALSHLTALTVALRDRNISLPITELRGRLEIADQRTLRLDRSVGLSNSSKRIILWTETDEITTKNNINNEVLGWLIESVAPYAQDKDQEHVSALKQLARARQAVQVGVQKTHPYEWNTVNGGTAKPVDPTGYANLADWVARNLEGAIVFPDLPGLRRVVSGQLFQNEAQLMTEPIIIGRSERFSLVVRIRVLSYPGRSLPVIVTDFSRRVWTTALKKQGLIRNISAYAFPEGQTRAYQFTIEKGRGKDGDYHLGADFIPIARRYFPGETLTAQHILQEGHRLPGCPLVIALKHGVGVRAKVKSGVPDLDKLDGFKNIAVALEKIGLRPWDQVQHIPRPAHPGRELNLPWTKRTSSDARKKAVYESWLEEALQTISTCYAGGHNILIAVQPGVGIEEDARYAERLLTDILGNHVTIQRVPIPSQVHGPRNNLPGAANNDRRNRAASRIAAWSPFIETAQDYERRIGRRFDGVLVIAREWYPNNQHDDIVNKRAARIALATGLGIPVQYLRPRTEVMEQREEQPARGRPKSPQMIADEIDKDFETRLMNAWLDLAYHSIGRVDPAMLSDKTAIDADLGTYPDRILALGVIRRNKSRWFANEPSVLPFAIELEVQRGICFASVAYADQEADTLVQTDWLPLPQAIVKIASLGPVQLIRSGKGMDYARRKSLLEERTQVFFKRKIAEVAARSTSLLILIDADTTKSFWPWLTDERIEPRNIFLAGGANEQMVWPAARLVRVRTNNSPKVLWEGYYVGSVPETGQEIRYPAPKWAQAEILKLGDTRDTHVYLSFGRILRKQAKGRSSYRELQGMKRTAKKPIVYIPAIMERYNDAWSTPAGVEFMVARSGPDHPDQVARLVAWLRQCNAHFGEWTIMPAPLSFADVLKEYVADYELDEEDAVDEDGLEDE